jgi:hypothetical protein
LSGKLINKKKEKPKVKVPKRQRESLSLHPLEFDEAVSALIKAPPQKSKN